MEERPTTPPAAAQPTPQGQRSSQWLVVVIIVLVLLGLCVAGYVAVRGMMTVSETITNEVANINTATRVSNPVPLDPSTVDSSIVAATLLSPDEVSTILSDNAYAGLVEFNDQLDSSLPDGYTFYVARTWYTEDFEARIANAITQYPTAEAAQQAIQILAADFEQLAPDKKVGDSSVVYRSDGDAVVYRFTFGNYVFKVQMFPLAHDTSSLTEATRLAAAQLQHFEDVLSGQIALPEETAAMKTVPTTLTGGTYIGTAPVTEEEWLSAIVADDIAGMTDGALSRFSWQARPGEVIEVTALEFLSESLAQEYQAYLVLDVAEDEVVTLPETMGDYVDAIGDEYIVELQAVRDNFVIDVSIFAPFGTLDPEAARTDLIPIAQEVLN